MIKQANRQPQVTNITNIVQTSPEKKTNQKPGDVISDRYILKELSPCGSLEAFKLSIASKLNEAEKAGYRFVDRIPVNQTESILIFERVK
jgi:hypothetical protein